MLVFLLTEPYDYPIIYTNMVSNIQQKLLEILRNAISSSDSLSMQDMANEIGVSSPNTILYHLRRLENAGLIRRDAFGKVIRVSSSDSVNAFAFLPLLGNAKCGIPLDQVVEENSTQMMPIPLRLLGRNISSNLYLVKAVGDSMSPKIEDGDFVVFEHTSTPKAGEIVVARTNEGFTIKILKEMANQYLLEPVNKRYGPLVFDKNQKDKIFNVDGVAVGVFKPQKNLQGGGV